MMIEFKGSHFERDVILWGVRVLFGCFAGTFSPSRRQIRSTRLRFAAQPASCSNAAMRR